MVDILRRKWYVRDRVLIETARILDPQFDDAIVALSGAQLELLRNLMVYVNRESTFATAYYDRYYLAPTTGEWDSLQSIVADLEEKLMGNGVGGFYDAYVCVRDVKAVDSDGGTFTAFVWQTRDINDEQSDEADICTILNNQIVLAAGSYQCSIVCPALEVDLHQARLRNITDSITLVLGTSQRSSYGIRVVGRSLVAGRFVLGEEKTLEVQHQCSSTKSGSGYGEAAHIGDEIFTVARFWREA